MSLLLVVIFTSTYLIYSRGVWESQFDDYSLNTIDTTDQRHLDCIGLLSGRNKTMEMLEKWTYDPLTLEDAILKSSDSCTLIKDQFEFRDKPLSKEEDDYPLAYGLIVYKEVVQVSYLFVKLACCFWALFVISAFFHPQNEYCISVSGTSDPALKAVIRKFSGCFPNIHIMERPPISWGSFEIINSTYACLEYLSNLKSKWMYYQYLSGTDVPLRTNLEMVRIFKVFNGTPNINYGVYPIQRLWYNNESDSPLPLIKSSLSTLIPRATADFIVKSNVTQELLKFLVGTGVPDESFWGTLTGNVKIFPIHGGFDAHEYLNYSENVELKLKFNESKLISDTNSSANSMNNYLSRYQLWGWRECKAHKFYLNFQPAAFFCAIREIRRRSSNPVPFDTQPYSEIPILELKRGVPYEELKHPSWIFSFAKTGKTFSHGVK